MNEMNGLGNGNDFDEFGKDEIREKTAESVSSFANSWRNGELMMNRFFTSLGKNPFQYDIYGNEIRWLNEEVRVTDDSGKVVFIQPNVRRPESWSSLAIKVVASKYFWGDIKKGQRESSVEQLVGRISRYIGRQALRQRYFDREGMKVLQDEIAAICLNQMAVFNSPVWFNAGIQEYDKTAGGVSAYRWDESSGRVISALKGEDNPQCSACFILSIKDDMDSIMEVQVAEANLFRAGSGTGTNRSNLRSSKETLTGGGKASGPVSFMKGYDAYAGIIKSGGKTRRAAKMEILNIDHPDIMEFISAKQNEEKKAWALIEQGFSGGVNGEAYSSVAFQNCNMSVRVNDEFMKAVRSDGNWSTKFVKSGEVCETFKAREVLKRISEGMQFEKGFLSPYMATNQEKMETLFEDPLILITDKTISSVKELVPCLELSAQESRPLLIIAEDIEGEALTTLVINLLRGTIKVCAVKSPGFGDEKRELLEDIAILTGGRVMSKEKEDKLETIVIHDLGSAAKIKVTKDETLIIEGKGDKVQIDKRITSIQSRIDSESLSYIQEDLQRRLAKLSGGVALINVGAVTETELKEKKMRIDDALHATKAAVEEGVIPGGGLTLYHASKELDLLSLSDEQLIGVKIVKKSLEGPIKQIAFNAGKDGAEILANLQSKDKSIGYNATTDTFEDLFKSGVIDPTKVVRNALQTASSIASLVITTEALVTDLDDEKKQSENDSIII